MQNSKATVTITILLITALLLAGCSDINRKHFTRLELIKTENGNQYFKYKAASGASGMTCAPGSKTCKVDNSYRVPIWPLDDKEAEKTRIKWLEKSLSEYGFRCENAEYEILCRELIFDKSKYDVCYDVKVKKLQ